MPTARIVVAVLTLALAGVAQTVSIQKEGPGYKVAGWNQGPTEPPGGWLSLFALYAGEGDVPPMLGSYTVESGTLTFRPRYPAAPGVAVRAVFRPPGGPPVEAVFGATAGDITPTTSVERVYPSASLLPDNQLKLYIQFSASMSRGEAWQRIHLLNEQGSAVELPFLEIDQELWDFAQRRLTVLFDPGRIKRGLVPREELGPVLIEGGQYTLVIDREWRDARGVALREGFRKQFRVGPADRVPPEPREWRLTTPAARTTDALVADIPEPMEWALLERLLQVSGPAGPVAGPVAGIVTVERGETQWRFVPAQPWQPGEYQLIVNTALEDLAGNKIGRPFDVDLDQFSQVTERVSSESVSLPFFVTVRVE